MLDVPVSGRIFFEHVIRDNLDIGRADQIGLIFDRRSTTAGNGRRQAGSGPGWVITDGGNLVAARRVQEHRLQKRMHVSTSLPFSAPESQPLPLDPADRGRR